MKIVGIKKADFTTKEGKEIKGYTIYFLDELEGNDCSGYKADSMYLSVEKLSLFKLDITNLIGKEVLVSYNSYGKPAKIIVVENKQ